MAPAKALTYKQRKQRVRVCFDDLLQIAETMIAQAKAGEIPLGASLLRELNAVLRSLQDYADTEEQTARPHEELRALVGELPEELRKPMRYS
jgi:hypothetical protein